MYIIVDFFLLLLEVMKSIIYFSIYIYFYCEEFGACMHLTHITLFISGELSKEIVFAFL